MLNQVKATLLLNLSLSIMHDVRGCAVVHVCAVCACVCVCLCPSCWHIPCGLGWPHGWGQQGGTSRSSYGNRQMGSVLQTSPNQTWWQSCTCGIPGLLLAPLFSFDFCSPECLHDNPWLFPYLCPSLQENPTNFLLELIVLSVACDFTFLPEMLLCPFFAVFFQKWVKFTLTKDFCDVRIRFCFLLI